jgi:hypothetical protein
VLPIDEGLDDRFEERFDDLVDQPAGAETTSVLPITSRGGVVALLRERPALALGLAALAAVLVAVVLLAALMPGARSPEAAPALPATGEPLHTHLQQLLESVSR